MKKIIFALIALVACGMVANAANPEINVGGTEVTSSNASRITGNDITSGYAVYDANTNTLTCYSIKIRRSGNGNYGIHNRKCDNLTIVFKGMCEVASPDHALNLARSTTIVVEEDSKADIYTGGGAHALNLGSYTYYIKGSGILELDGKNAIHGNGSGSTTVYFQGAKVLASSYRSNNHALESFKAVFNEGADLTIEANGEMTSVNNTSMYFYGKEKILEPFDAYYSNSAVYNSSGNQITSDDIYISDNYVAIINEDNFPDFYFRNSILTLYPRGFITQTDINDRTSLKISYKGIYDLTGLTYFNKLKSLDCNHNNIKSLPSLASTLTELNCDHNQLTSLPSLPSTLTELNCNYNQLTSLPSLPTGLVTLYCDNNKFTSLNITGKTSLKTLSAKNNTSLTSLSCTGNALTTLDVSGCTALKSLYCQNNQLTSLGTLPSTLQSINCANNKFSTLAINGMSTLKELYAQNNTSMTQLYCRNNALTTLNVDGCTALKNLYCSANQLTTLPTLPNYIEVVEASDNCFTGTMTITDKRALWMLNVANNPSLTKLECYSNALTALILGGCSELSYLNCGYNQLASLDVRGLNKLETLRAYRNGMTSFNCTNCSALKVLLVCYNNLTSLDLTGCTALSELWIQKNQIKGNAMTSLINTLRSIPKSEPEGLFGVYEQPYPMDVLEDNQLTNAQYMAARAKRWIPKQYNGSWLEIPLSGDVNGDGKVNVSDVTALINMIMGITTMDATVADVNGDGKVNVSDVSALINIILNIK